MTEDNFMDMNLDAAEMRTELTNQLIKNISEVGQKIIDQGQKLQELEERFISLEAQLNALEYLTRPKEKVGRFVEDVQDKMYRISKDITEKLKPQED
jgi:vacuolar-type H+-ATPase subunit I/STV1